MQKYWFLTYIECDKRLKENKFYNTVLKIHPFVYIRQHNADCIRMKLSLEYKIIQYSIISEEEYNNFLYGEDGE